MLHPGVSEPDRQVGGPLTGGDDLHPLEVLEDHIPQPGQVLTVGDLAVDRDDQAVGGAVHHRQGLLPAGRVLRQQQVHLAPLEAHRRIASGDIVDPLGSGDGVLLGDTEGDGGGDGLRRIAAVGVAREGEVQVPVALRGVQAGRVDRHARGRTPEL